MLRLKENTVVLVVGGTGSVGSMVIKKLLELGVQDVRVLARDETKHADLLSKFHSDASKLTPIIGDVRDARSLRTVLNGADIVIDAAAMKHVWYCEQYPVEAYKTNVMGISNLADLCEEMGVKQLVYISSDKAADPTTAYGASKMMGERVVLSRSHMQTGCIMSVVRFGNILYSRNSILSHVKNALDKKAQISLVNEKVTRFFMTQDQAASLVVDAIEYSHGGEIFAYNMPMVDIRDLVHAYVRRYAEQKGISTTEVSFISHQFGYMEKNDEKLFSHTELQYLQSINEELLCVNMDHVNSAKFNEKSRPFHMATNKVLDDMSIELLLDKADREILA